MPTTHDTDPKRLARLPAGLAPHWPNGAPSGPGPHDDPFILDPARQRARRRRGITLRLVRRDVESSEQLGRYRWAVERTIAWLLAFLCLTVRYDRHAATVVAFLHLACALICLRFRRRAEAP